MPASEEDMITISAAFGKDNTQHPTYQAETVLIGHHNGLEP